MSIRSAGHSQCTARAAAADALTSTISLSSSAGGAAVHTGDKPRAIEVGCHSIRYFPFLPIKCENKDILKGLICPTEKYPFVSLRLPLNLIPSGLLRVSTAGLRADCDDGN